MKIPSRPKVIIRHCDEYDPGLIRGIIADGLRELDLTPSGRTLVKPNCVASKPQFPHAYTRPEFLEGVLMALREKGGDRMSELAVGERCGITVPTRMAFEGAEYYPMFRRTGVKHYHFEEVPQVEIPLTHKERLRDYVFTPEPVAKSDFFVNCPKFKSHPWTTVTFSLKNYIGIQDDRHRLIDHDHRLDEKIADLQYIVQPKFIAIDAIEAGEGRMLTPIPRRLNLILMGDCQVAFDAVCCAIIGLGARTVDHIRMAHERGFGPIDLDQIDISGDVSLKEAKLRATGFKVGLIRVEKYFEGTNISAYAGPPPDPERTDYCWGGCPGAIEEAIEILRQFDSQCDANIPRMHVVFGAYEGPIPAKENERVIFIGDCAKWSGEIANKPIKIESLYRDRSVKDPHTVKHDDIYAKMLSVTQKFNEAKKTRSPVRLTGCPVSVAEQVLALVAATNIKNPILDPKNAIMFNRAYLAWRGNTLAQRAQGKPYQVNGPTTRGDGAPEVVDPTPAAEK